MPASAAEYPSSTLEITGLSYPTIAVKITARTNAIIKLKIGPAAMTEILAHTDFLLKFPGDSVSSSSSPIAQNPPIGNKCTA